MKKLLIISTSVLINIAIFAANGDNCSQTPLDHNSPELKATFKARQGICTLANAVNEKVCTGRKYLLSSKHCLSNPDDDQTEQGLYLNFCEGMPTTLHSPWGQVAFCWLASLNFSVKEEVNKSFLEKMILKPVEDDDKLFSIVSFDGIELPDAEELDEKHYREYKAVTESWNTMMAQCEQEEKKALN